MVSTPSWPIEMKLPSGSWRRNAAGTASRPFSSTRTRCVPQNIHVAYLGARPGLLPPPSRGRVGVGGEDATFVLSTAAAGNGGCCEVCCDRCREEGFDVGKSVL